jgi:hypothetical protein
MTALLNFSLPQWGRVGVGAGTRRALSAPIPTFPQWGKEKDP